MGRDEKTADDPIKGTSPNPTRRATKYALIILSTIVITLLDIPIVIGGLIETFTSTVSPGYDIGRQVQIALSLMQVAVLYFGGLVAVFRFIDVPSSLDAGVNQNVSYLFILAIFSVSTSALSSVVTVMNIFPDISILIALLSMRFAFFLSFFSPVLVLVRSAEATTRRDSDGTSEQRQPDSDENNTNSGRSNAVDNDRRDTDTRDIDTVRSDADEDTVSRGQSATTREDSDAGVGHRDDGRIRRWERDKK